uniref:Uncharacterized protein n=1 Tax=Romanomermis culicivorax TaxID=13658 RepID=A0A915JIJ9_ROMCU
MTFVDNVTGDPDAERFPKEATIIRPVPADTTIMNTYAIYMNYEYAALWEQHIHYNAVPAPYVTMLMDSSPASSQSNEVPLALLALP